MTQMGQAARKSKRYSRNSPFRDIAEHPVRVRVQQFLILKKPPEGQPLPPAPQGSGYIIMNDASIYQSGRTPVSLRKASSLLILVLLTACEQPAPEPVPTATVQLFTPVPTVSTPTLLPSPLPPTPTLTATLGPFTPFTARPSVDALKLRVGPGSLFGPIQLLYDTETVTVLGKAPGGEWFLVETLDEVQGWVFGQLLEAEQDLQTAPVTQPEDAQVVRGRLADSDGVPISGIQFALTLGDTARTDAMTDENGEFYAFLPPDVSGDWLVSYVAIACTSNAFADQTCSSYSSGYTGVVQPDTRPVTLPTESTLIFQWH
jgi:hypothetical protein